MTDIQSSHNSTVATTIEGIPFIETESVLPIQSGDCVLKVLSVCGRRLVDNNVRIFNAIAPFVPGGQVEMRLHPSYCPTAVQPDHEEPQEETQQESQAETRALVVTETRLEPREETRKNSAWWRIIRRPKSDGRPNEKAMLIDYLFHGCVHLPEGHPQYGERKALLLRKGFHYSGERGAWVPDPKWTPDAAPAS